MGPSVWNRVNPVVQRLSPRQVGIRPWSACQSPSSLFKGRFLDPSFGSSHLEGWGRVHFNGHMSDSDASVGLPCKKCCLGLNKGMQ